MRAHDQFPREDVYRYNYAWLNSVVDPHYFDADPDADPASTYHFDADPDPDSDFCLMRIRILGSY